MFFVLQDRTESLGPGLFDQGSVGSGPRLFDAYAALALAMAERTLPHSVLEDRPDILPVNVFEADSAVGFGAT